MGTNINNINNIIDSIAQGCKKRSGTFEICSEKNQPCKRVIEQGECPAITNMFKK